MSTEDLIAMARQSHLDVFGLGNNHHTFVRTLEDFAKLIEARTREECAVFCDEVPAPPSCNTLERNLWDVATVACADGIRSMGERT